MSPQEQDPKQDPLYITIMSMKLDGSEEAKRAMGAALGPRTEDEPLKTDLGGHEKNAPKLLLADLNSMIEKNNSPKTAQQSRRPVQGELDLGC